MSSLKMNFVDRRRDAPGEDRRRIKCGELGMTCTDKSYETRREPLVEHENGVGDIRYGREAASHH